MITILSDKISIKINSLKSLISIDFRLNYFILQNKKAEHLDKIQSYQKLYPNFLLFQHFLMPAVGLEPTRCCQQQILSLPRLPFRHAGISYEHMNININKNKLQA